MKKYEGIRLRHRGGCPARDGGQCRCEPAYEAWVYSPADGKKIRRTFANVSEAKSWRRDAARAVERRELRAPTAMTLREAFGRWADGAESGQLRALRGGAIYKPSVVRSYRQTFETHVDPVLGTWRLSDIRRADLVRLKQTLLGRGLSGSTIRNAFAPLRVVLRHAVDLGELAVSPMDSVDLPAADGKRDRCPDLAEATRLLEALSDADSAIYAVAYYAALRTGEVQALRWQDVDIANGCIRVARAYDPKSSRNDPENRRFVAPKSKAGRRTVPMFGPLKSILAAHRLRSGRTTGLVFGRDGETPFDSRALVRRAATAWKRAGIGETYSPHEFRHGGISLWLMSNMNLKEASVYAGHASIIITLDRYGHLLGGGDKAQEQVDAYLAAAATGASTGAS